ncbi:hypothetical protein [Mastigocoleus sp. MO_188.B34]|uniref:hypothetical protein n=1 Tax=Mastigocoleus sp. MO_188.B34 TaxID=3036635 RepID=UPI0026116558|nr:hypothetical protein [Mastigocoleus sp. MO_188.B34]MDJ0697605.1 hypothetical protein [Mastigocoleus sp. MO_188.B34]
MATETKTTQESAIVTVSEETKALVEQKMSDESDEIKQKMGELVELIKRRAELELESAGEMTREAYITAINQAKSTLKKTEDFFAEQEKSLAQKIQDFNNEANQHWESFVADIQKMNNRVDKAIEAAWKNLTETEETKS